MRGKWGKGEKISERKMKNSNWREEKKGIVEKEFEKLFQTYCFMFNMFLCC